jgi:hypothetical protein
MPKTNFATVADPQALEKDRGRRWDQQARWHRAQSGSGNLICQIDGLGYTLSIRKSRRRGWPSWWAVGVAVGGGEVEWLPPHSSLAGAKAAARFDYCRRPNRAEQAVRAGTQSPAPTQEPEWRIGFDEVLDGPVWLLDLGGWRWVVDTLDPLSPPRQWRWRAYDINTRRAQDAMYDEFGWREDDEITTSSELFDTADIAKAAACLEWRQRTNPPGATLDVFFRD